MKTIQFFKSWTPLLAFFSFFIFSSCENDDNGNVNATYKISGDASGSQEVPVISTAAAGTLTGNYDSGTNILDYTITWTGLSGNVNDAHLHGPAVAGANAGVIHPLTITTNGTTGIISGTVTLADSTEAHLLGGKLYYNLHTTLNPSGEIRGQIVTQMN